ncbi:MAG: 4Fe-4S binding protein, partial [Candidatus Bathyarchaeia archaeon]
IQKEQILNKSSIMQKVIKPKENLLNRLLSKHGPLLEKIDTNYIKWAVSNDENFPIACIHCANAPCMFYKTQVFGQTDAFSSRVCPADLVKESYEGTIQIDKKDCGGCMLCILRCPIDAIFLKEGVAEKREYSNLTNYQKYVDDLIIPFIEKEKETLKAIDKLVKISTFNVRIDIKEILDNFDLKISAAVLNWDQDRYYVWTRNCFRELGVEALYTGAAGKLRRADITIRKPFFAGIEVKSPAEGEISVGALRQAVDARREVWKTYSANEVYCAVVGQEIGRGVHARASEWYSLYKVKIPLLRGRYLLYLMLKNRTTLPQDPLRDIKRLFTDFFGWFGKEELKQYFEAYFKMREEELKSGKISLPMPLTIIRALRTKNKNEALSILEHIKKETYKEIERCFPDPERTARGGYATARKPKV